jgi:hypothetical protein
MSKHNNLENVIDQFLNGKAGELQPHTIPLTDAMIERLELYANEFDITVEEAASALLWGYLISIDHATEKVRNQIMPKN